MKVANWGKNVCILWVSPAPSDKQRSCLAVSC